MKLLTQYYAEGPLVAFTRAPKSTVFKPFDPAEATYSHLRHYQALAQYETLS